MGILFLTIQSCTESAPSDQTIKYENRQSSYYDDRYDSRYYDQRYDNRQYPNNTSTASNQNKTKKSSGWAESLGEITGALAQATAEGVSKNKDQIANNIVNGNKAHHDNRYPNGTRQTGYINESDTSGYDKYDKWDDDDFDIKTTPRPPRRNGN